MKNKYIEVGRKLRNSNIVEHDEFNKIFSDFQDGKTIQNTGGFRYKSKIGGPTNIEECAFVILVTNFEEEEWPDKFDEVSRTFIYHGDNRKVNNDIHNTRIGGNRLLKSIEGKIKEGRFNKIPPILAFHSIKEDKKSYMKFLGLVAPRLDGSFIKIINKNNGQGNFVNYEADFMLLTENKVNIKWLHDLAIGIEPNKSRFCPIQWKVYVSRNINERLAEIAIADVREEQNLCAIDFSMTLISKSIKSKSKRKKQVRPAININYSDRNNIMKEIGTLGEEVTYFNERKRLIREGRMDLVDQVKWISKNVSENEGYDILSWRFNTCTCQYERIMIEVKTTKGSISEPFYLTSNEHSVWEQNKDNYFLYRLGNFKGGNYDYYELTWEDLNSIKLVPTEYMVYGNE